MPFINWNIADGRRVFFKLLPGFRTELSEHLRGDGKAVGPQGCSDANGFAKQVKAFVGPGANRTRADRAEVRFDDVPTVQTAVFHPFISLVLYVTQGQDAVVYPIFGKDGEGGITNEFYDGTAAAVHNIAQKFVVVRHEVGNFSVGLTPGLPEIVGEIKKSHKEIHILCGLHAG